MMQYTQTQKAIRLVEHQAPREGVTDFLLVADLFDHLDAVKSVHVDAARAALDWFCARHPDHPICLASAARQNTRRAWEAFGYAHLPKEYPRLRLLDLNAESLPQASLTLHLTTRNSSPWGAYLTRPQRMYTPRGHVWIRMLTTDEPKPHLTIVVQ